MPELLIESPDYNGNRRSVLQEYYGRYLSEVRGVKESTVCHYFDALNNISRRLKEKGLVKEDIYEIMNIDYLMYVSKVLKTDPDFVEADTRGRRMYSAGLNHYCKFANGEEMAGNADSLVKMDIPVSPEEPVIVEQTVWKRSNILRQQVLLAADYQCEIDKTHQTFISGATKKPYMEGHHAIPMKLQEHFEHSLDVYANIVCLCPICHRRIHHGIDSDKAMLMNQIYAKRKDRLANSGIMLSREEFSSLVIANEPQAM